MRENCEKALSALVGATLIFQSVGCGTILYPERKGQKAGKIDVGVAVLDAIGLLFFIIPGVIAFAVDFNNGAIYLPKGARGALNSDDFEKLRFDPKGDAKARVENILRRETGLGIRLDQGDLQVSRLESPEEIPARFAAVRREAVLTARASR